MSLFIRAASGVGGSRHSIRSWGAEVGAEESGRRPVELEIGATLKSVGGAGPAAEGGWQVSHLPLRR